MRDSSAASYNKTERSKYLNPKVAMTTKMLLPQKFGGIEKTNSVAVLSTKQAPKIPQFG